MSKAQLPKLGVFTPLSAAGNHFIEHTHASLQQQDYAGSWEWLVLENNGGKLPERCRTENVRVVQGSGIGIGALKRQASYLAQGEYIVELDHDDLLAPNALTRIAEALSEADFVFSDFAEFHDGSWAPHVYDPAFGWKSYDVEFQGHSLKALRAPEATPQNLRRIEFAPNHVRAWRADAYREVGGHDPTLKVADDFDLMLRFFLKNKRFARIPECLYFYRVHAGNTVKLKNQDIQQAAGRLYDKHIWALAEKFATGAGLTKLDLCGAHGAPPGYMSIDLAPGVDIQADLDGTWPVADGSVGLLRAHDALEHLRDPIHAMNEAHRVLAPGGFLMIMVPSTDGRGAFQDPTHRSFWNQNSFWYYTKPKFAAYIPAFKGQFQVSRCQTIFPSEWHRENQISYVEAHLIAVKGDYEPMGGL